MIFRVFIPENCFLNKSSEYDTVRLLVQILKWQLCKGIIPNHDWCQCKYTVYFSVQLVIIIIFLKHRMHFRLNKQVHHASYDQPGAPVNLRYIEKYNQYLKEKIFPIILFLQLKFLLITTESLIFYRPPGACKKNLMFQFQIY